MIPAAAAVPTGTPASVVPHAALDAVAARLSDVASMVSQEAAAATDMVRLAAEDMRQIAALVIELDAAATLVERNVRKQLKLLARAQRLAADHMPLFDTLGETADSILVISGTIGGIAARSRLLALNARIEAARQDGHGGGFAAVAAEMTVLSAQTMTATADIDARTGAVGDHVAQVRGAFADSSALIDHERDMIEGIADTAQDQRRNAGTAASLTGEAVDRIDAAATIIGRVASAATTVNVIARQLSRVAAASTR